MYQRATPTIAHLKEVAEYCKRLDVSTKIYINPLSSLKEGFYTGGILFSCLYDKKSKDVFAAGGRYDSLIREQRLKTGGQSHERHAVGFSLAWERLARVPKAGGKSFLKKAEEEAAGLFSGRRVGSVSLPLYLFEQMSDKKFQCDALVASFDSALLRSAGVELLQTLWSHNLSAELARDARSPEELMARHREETYSWVIIIKQDSMLKVKSVGKKEVPDVDMPITQLLSWLRSEIRDRDARALTKIRGGSSSHAEQNGQHTEKDHEQSVKVLVSQTKSKKFNRRTVVEQAQVSATSLVQSFLTGSILAVETTDQVIDLVQETTLSDSESWRKVEHSVTTSEKKYVREIHDQLDTWRYNYEKNNGSRHAFLYNFRTGHTIYYDLGTQC